MILEPEQHEAWKAHLDRYAVCPRCGADGELEGSCDVVDPAELCKSRELSSRSRNVKQIAECKAGEPVVLRELMECPACDHRWHEEWVYRGHGTEGAH